MSQNLPVGTKVTPASTAHPFYGKVFVVIDEVVTDVETGSEYVIAKIEGFAHEVEAKLFHKYLAVVSTPAPVSVTPPPAAPETLTATTDKPGQPDGSSEPPAKS